MDGRFKGLRRSTKYTPRHLRPQTLNGDLNHFGSASFSRFFCSRRSGGLNVFDISVVESKRNLLILFG